MRPIIGVALGSGAARGWAQIGVLEGLAALGVVPEVVSGTSIGALVGAAFVTGKLAALKTRMEHFGRRDVAAMLDVHLTTGGLIEGRRVESFLDSLGIAGSIETQGPRYAAVATDLASGREIWLQQGPIGRAVRASIGMPGVFSPTRHDDRWLIDGGLVNPVPVSLARALGADIVIAVDLNSELIGRRFSGSDTDLAAATTAPAVSARAPQWLTDAAGPILQERAPGRTRLSKLLRSIGEFFEHHAGSYYPDATRRRSSRCASMPKTGGICLAGFSSRK